MSEHEPRPGQAKQIRRAATDRWGADRAEELGTALSRLATAIATVESFPLADGIEPFPTGPEAPGD